MMVGLIWKAKSRWEVLGLMVVLAIVTMGCGDDYEPLIICHNANCLEPANPEDDSTKETLQA